VTLDVLRELLDTIKTQPREVTIDRVGGRRRDDDAVVQDVSKISKLLRRAVHGRIVYSAASAAPARVTTTSSL